MPALHIDIKDVMIDWIIQKAQYEHMGNSILDLLFEWKSGKKKPTFKKIEEVSRRTHIPFGYFFLNSPPEENISLVDFRTIDSEHTQNPSRNLIDTINAMQRVQDWMANYYQENGYDPLPYIGCCNLKENHKAIAEDIRSKLGITKEWFKLCKDSSDAFRFLRSRISALGILVMKNGIVGNNTSRKLNLNEFRAFTLINEYAPLIFINSNDTDNGKLFSLLHELAHVWLGENSLYNEPYASQENISRLEQICNSIAAEILAPDKLFIEQWKAYHMHNLYTLYTLGEISKHFRCSRFVIIRKALENGFISREEFGRTLLVLQGEYQKWQQDKKKKGDGGGNFYKTLATRWDRTFINALDEMTRSGSTQYTEAYRLTGTQSSSFSKLIQEINNS